MIYQPDENRYHTMGIVTAGAAERQTSAISLGLWRSFGDATRVKIAGRCCNARSIWAYPL